MIHDHLERRFEMMKVHQVPIYTSWIGWTQFNQLVKRRRKRWRRETQEKSHPNLIKNLIESSSKSIIHFGGLEFSPHQHPRPIEFDETYDQNSQDPIWIWFLLSSSSSSHSIPFSFDQLDGLCPSLSWYVDLYLMNFHNFKSTS